MSAYLKTLGGGGHVPISQMRKQRLGAFGWLSEASPASKRGLWTSQADVAAPGVSRGDVFMLRLRGSELWGVWCCGAKVLLQSRLYGDPAEVAASASR
jgi:hypothetical protein